MKVIMLQAVMFQVETKHNITPLVYTFQVIHTEY